MHSAHGYTFFGDTLDPSRSGIETIPKDRLQSIDFRVAKTWQPDLHIAVQPAAVMNGVLGNFDVFIFEGAFTHPTAWMAIQAAKLRGKRVLLYTHGWKRRDVNPLIGRMRLAFMRLADGIVLYGQKARGIALSLGLPGSRLYVAFNSLDYRMMADLRKTFSVQERQLLKMNLFGDTDLPIVTHIGRLNRAKRIDQLLAACHILNRHGHKMGLLVIGGGPELGRVQESARSLNFPVHFAGALYDERQVGLMLSTSNVLAAPGPIGLAAIHAMTYGTPVVTCDAWDIHGPEYEAVIPGRTGAFFRTDDVESLAAALLPFVLESGTHFRYASNTMAIVDRYYNPSYMRHVFDLAVSGQPAEIIPSVYAADS